MDQPLAKNLHTRPSTHEERRYYARLVAQLVDRRKSLGLSQAELNDRIGVSDAMVAKWESMARMPGAFYLMCWAQALGVSLYAEEGECA